MVGDLQSFTAKNYFSFGWKTKTPIFAVLKFYGNGHLAVNQGFRNIFLLSSVG